MCDALSQSYRQCERIARTYARNFYLGFRLLPPQKRQAICAVYAFMRYADDLADEHKTPDDAALDRWLDALSAAVSGVATDDPIMLALSDTVKTYDIPMVYFADLIAGVRSDMVPVSFATFDELENYCYRVAGVVGLACLRIWGVSDTSRAEAIAVRCGTAFQLTNVLRDIREDASRSRVYLPDEDLHRFGLSRSTLLERVHARQARSLIAFEAERARAYFESCAELPALISPDSRGTFLAMFLIYRALLDKIAGDPSAPLRSRVSLSLPKKLATLTRAIVIARGTHRPG